MTEKEERERKGRIIGSKRDRAKGEGMNGPGSHQHRGLGMQGRYRAVVTAGTPAGPHSRPPAPPHARGGWHPHNQHPQHAQIPQQYTGNKEYPYRQCPPPRFHNGYIIAITNLVHLLCIY